MLAEAVAEAAGRDFGHRSETRRRKGGSIRRQTSMKARAGPVIPKKSSAGKAAPDKEGFPFQVETLAERTQVRLAELY
jgi:hypothetical protein